MADPEIQVSIGSPDIARIETGNPVVTIVSPSDPANTTQVSPEESSVIITDEHPKVHISYDFSTDIGKTALLELLEDSLDVDQFSTEMASDIELLRDLWVRVGDDVEQVLIDADVSNITQIATDYTDTQIQTIAVDISRVDGDIASNTSSITQTANSINSRIDAFEIDTDNNFTAQSARLDINSSDISLSVTRMDGIDGDVTQNQSDIIQTADSVTIEVAAREALEDGAVTENTTRSVQTAASLVAVVQSNTQLNGRVDSAETRLTATEAVTTILTQEFDASRYSLQSVESLTSSAYGVTITETVGGIPYVSGFELILHPAWAISTVDYDYNYAVDDATTYTDGKVYNCILDHVSTIDTSPGSVAWATYWELFADTAQSAFNIQADSFSVITPGGLEPVFVVDGGTGAVSINGDLVISGSIESDTYAAQDPNVSWYKLDQTTGSADFNNVTFSIGGNGITTLFDTFPVVLHANATRTGGAFESSGSAWGTYVYSTNSYGDGCVTNFVPASLDKCMVGLTDTPGNSNNYVDIDYAFYLPGSTSLFAFESGVSIGAIGSFAIGDSLSIKYTGDEVQYIHNGTVLRTVSVDNKRTFYFGADLETDGSITNTEFYAASASTKTAIDGGLITTGIIRDTSSNLVIDFDTATMTVNNSSGLVINSGGGVQVNSGGNVVVNNGGNIAVNSGGDISLNGISGNTAELQFQYNATKVAYLTSYSSGLSIRGVTASVHDLDVGNFDTITMTAHDQVDVVVNGNAGQSDIGFVSGTSHASLIAGSSISGGLTAFIATNASATATSNYLDLVQGNQKIRMYKNCIYHTGMAKMTAATALTSTYTSLLTSNGDYFEYVNIADFYFPSIVFRNSSGTFESRRSIS